MYLETMTYTRWMIAAPMYNQKRTRPAENCEKRTRRRGQLCSGPEMGRTHFGIARRQSAGNCGIAAHKTKRNAFWNPVTSETPRALVPATAQSSRRTRD